MLSTNPKYFVADDSDAHTLRWSYTTPPPPPPSPLVSSLENLKSGLPTLASSTSPNRFQHTLQTFIDFTGYLTAQVYTVSSATLGYRPPGTHTTSLSPQEEEVRKEIRALKGLVLNRYVNATASTGLTISRFWLPLRRTFMPSRPSSTSIANEQV